MQNDNEQIQVEFHNNASAIFFALLTNFETVIKGINRQTEEYKFQQVKEAHIHSLKQQLENRAMLLMPERRGNRKKEELSQNLQHFIQQYLHLFVQKARTV
jgi:hypothetical protein